MNWHAQKTLVLGLGNVIMGDEGVGVHVVRALEKHTLPAGVECLDGGTGGFILLEPLQNAGRIILIDAAADGNPPGTVTRTTPRFSQRLPSHAHGARHRRQRSARRVLHAGRIARGRALRHRHRSPAAHLHGAFARTARAAQEAEQRILAELLAAEPLSLNAGSRNLRPTVQQILANRTISVYIHCMDVMACCRCCMPLFAWHR